MSHKNDKNAQSAAEAELTELSRKYRIMEGDRRSYTEEAQGTMKKQKVALDKLKSENDHLREELANYTRSMSHKESVALNAKSQTLADGCESLTRKIEAERRKIDDLDRQKRAFGIKFKERKETTGGLSAVKENAAAVDKQVRILENRLDKALVKFNEALAVNRTLREEIDSLRSERVVFDGIYKKLERELHDRKRGMAAVIEVSNIAYEERDAAQNELAAMRQTAEREMANLDEEFRKLDRALENDRKQKEFLKSKERGRMRSGGADGGAAPADGAASSEDVNGAMSAEDEQKAKRRTIKSQVSHARDKQMAAEAGERAAEYEAAVQKIREATGINDMDELVSKFVAAEDRNFSLFNYVNELNNEIERIEEQIAEIRAEMDRYKGQGATSDTQRKKILTDLGERLAKTEARAQEYETKAEDAQRVLNDLKGSIQSAFERAGCDGESIGEVLGGQGVTEGNMMQYLGVVEQKTNELLQRYNVLLQRSIDHALADDAALQSEASRDADLSATNMSVNRSSITAFPGPAAPAGAQVISIVPPSTGEEYVSEDDSEVDDEERPLTRDELKARSSRMITKREKKGSSPDKKKPSGQQRAARKV